MTKTKREILYPTLSPFGVVRGERGERVISSFNAGKYDLGSICSLAEQICFIFYSDGNFLDTNVHFLFRFILFTCLSLLIQ